MERGEKSGYGNTVLIIILIIMGDIVFWLVSVYVWFNFEKDLMGIIMKGKSMVYRFFKSWFNKF